MTEKLLPLNRSGDEEGSHFENGTVRTPAGFKQAYDEFAAGGWISLAADPAYGGQGLPLALHVAVEEMICSTNLSFGMFPGLSQGAYNVMLHGSEELKQRYLPGLVDGSVAGTMCLTEPQCGTDLGLVRTKAEPYADGSYKITGSKIFISAGEHDLTENILHLVLARLPDAPAGRAASASSWCPSSCPTACATASPAAASRRRWASTPRPACQMNFDGATGWLVGRPHKGMSAMFTMMNAARLGVAIQGLGLAEAAYQGARDYALTRLQGRSLAGPKFPDKPADPLIVHPDIRRMLLGMKARIEAARALAAWVALAADEAAKHPDPERRQAADDLVALMTPIVKASFTDMGFDCASTAVADLGRPWLYPRERHGAADARCPHHPDLRRRQRHPGPRPHRPQAGAGHRPLLRRFFHPVAAFIEEAGAEPALVELTLPLAKAFARLQQLTAQIAQAGLKDPEEAGAAASDYLLLRAGGPGLYVGPHGARRLGAAGRREIFLLQGQAGDGALLHGEGPAAAGGAVPDDRQRQADADGAAGRGFLSLPRAGRRHPASHVLPSRHGRAFPGHPRRAVSRCHVKGRHR